MTISTCSFVHKTLQNLHLNTRSALTFDSNGELAGTLRAKNLIIFASLGLTRFSERRDVKSITKGRCVRMLVGLLSKRFGKIIRIWSLFSVQHGSGGEYFGQTLKLKSNTSHVYKSLLGRLSKQNTFYGERTQSKTKHRSDEGWQEIRWCRWFSKKWFFTNKQDLNMHRHESNCKYDIAMFLMMICWQGFVVLTGKCFCAAWKLIWDFWKTPTFDKILKCWELLGKALRLAWASFVIFLYKKVIFQFFLIVKNLALLNKTPPECPKSSPTSTDAANRFIRHLACVYLRVDGKSSLGSERSEKLYKLRNICSSRLRM